MTWTEYIWALILHPVATGDKLASLLNIYFRLKRNTSALLTLNQFATESFKSKLNKLRILISFIHISMAKFTWFSCKLFHSACEVNDRNKCLFPRFQLLVFSHNAYSFLPLMEMYSVFMIVHFQYGSAKLFQALRLRQLHDRVYRLKEKGDWRALSKCTQLFFKQEPSSNPLWECSSVWLRRICVVDFCFVPTLSNHGWLNVTQRRLLSICICHVNNAMES